MSQNVYFEASIPDVRILTEPEANLQPSARACCASCHDIPACSAFQWCACRALAAHACFWLLPHAVAGWGGGRTAAPRRRGLVQTVPAGRPPCSRRCPLQEGCAVPGAANTSFPYEGCQLLDLAAFLRSSVNTGEIKVSGPGVAFTTGQPGGCWCVGLARVCSHVWSLDSSRAPHTGTLLCSVRRLAPPACLPAPCQPSAWLARLPAAGRRRQLLLPTSRRLFLTCRHPAPLLGAQAERL